MFIQDGYECLYRMDMNVVREQAIIEREQERNKIPGIRANMGCDPLPSTVTFHLTPVL